MRRELGRKGREREETGERKRRREREGKHMRRGERWGNGREEEKGEKRKRTGKRKERKGTEKKKCISHLSFSMIRHKLPAKKRKKRKGGTLVIVQDYLINHRKGTKRNLCYRCY